VGSFLTASGFGAGFVIELTAAAVFATVLAALPNLPFYFPFAAFEAAAFAFFFFFLIRCLFM